MHYNSAKRGIAILCRPSVCPSVCLSVCDVGGSGPGEDRITALCVASRGKNISVTAISARVKKSEEYDDVDDNGDGGGDVLPKSASNRIQQQLA